MLKRFMLKFKYKKGSQNAITTYIIHYMYINPYLWQIELKKILLDIHKFPFPSISDYFYIPIIFDHFNIHCPTEAMVVGTIFFPVRVEEQFFFSTIDFNSLSELSSTKIGALGNRSRTASLKGQSAIHYTVKIYLKCSTANKLLKWQVIIHWIFAAHSVGFCQFLSGFIVT